jgi:ABC-type polysaccharide transport system, permease component
MDNETIIKKTIPKNKNGNVILNVLKELFKNKALYSMAIPGAIVLFLFNYLPLFGLFVAFKEFNFKDGILGSPWVNPIYKNFEYLFTAGMSPFRVTFNTIYLNLLFIIFGLIFQVGLALIFNEIGSKTFKKISQSMMFLPYFVSWIVVGLVSYNLLSYDTGVINSVLTSLGHQKIDWYRTTNAWPVIVLIFYIWKSTGYGMILYLSTLAGVDPTYYEAAEIDGATKMQQIKNISIPMLMPTIITLTLLHLGRIMNADFGMFFSIVGDNPSAYKVVDVIDTFVYRSLRLNGDIGMASAAGFYQSVISFILIMLCNRAVQKYDSEQSLF